MLPDRSVARRPLWGVALVSMLLAGCQEASTTPLVPAPAIAAGLDAAQPLVGRRARQAQNAEAHAARIAAAVDRGRGRVTVGAEARPALRRVLGAGFATSGITHARLTVLGADMRTVRTEPTPWTPATTAAIAPPPHLTVEVPAGLNRVFVLEALDAHGAVVASMRSLGVVEAGKDARVTFNALTDAAGRTLQACIEYLFPQGPFAATLTSVDYTTALVDYVAHVTAYDPATHTFNRLDPLYFNDVQMARQLEDDMTGYRLQSPALPLPEQLTAEAVGAVALEVVHSDGTPVDGDVTVTLHDPVEDRTPLSLEDRAPYRGREVFMFDEVPSGFFDVTIETNGAVLHRQVLVEDGLVDNLVVVLPEEELN